MRVSGKSGRKKIVKTRAQTGANPLMTLDFFEGSDSVGPQKNHDSLHTRQLKEFVFIQQQNF
jgi:hypothetical protein